jgi:DnaB-like helicase C terminal domain
MDRRHFVGSVLAARLGSEAPADNAEGSGRSGQQPGTLIDTARPVALLEGMGQRDVRVLAGPPGSGKTTFALQAALAVCVERGQHVVYVRGPESFEALVSMVAARDAKRFFDCSMRSGFVDTMNGAVPLMKTPRIWVEDPQMLEFWATPPFFCSWLQQKSPIQCGLAIIDALATEPREMHEKSYPAVSEDFLVPYQLAALEEKVPRLVIVDSKAGEPVRLSSFATGWVPGCEIMDFPRYC